MTYFNQYIQINGTQTLIIASLLMFAMDMAFAAILYILALTSVVAIGCIPLIIGIILLPFIGFIKLYCLNRFLPGFHINGVLTYLLLVASLSIFKLREPNKKNNEDNKIKQN
jgi:predicted neutral ceramidase superfamily lipid hydrolase